jgi:DNA-directed RNA polymerase subunit H (RpoH/RPB5)
MSTSQKINKSRYSLKKILSDEWDTSTIHDYSEQELDKIYSIPAAQAGGVPFPGVAGACNFTLSHKRIPSHKLHIFYYNFPENGRKSSKVTKSACDKIEDYYTDESINDEDSMFIIINDIISESLEKSFNELNVKLQGRYTLNDISDTIKEEMKQNDISLEKRHFRNVYLFNIDNFTNNILEHRLIPPHKHIRENKKIEEVLEKSNCRAHQLPIILKSDIMSKMLRLTSGDICEITRTSDKSGTYPFYRVCR